ncbi:MAG: glutamine synthetase family protein [Anaerofustis sp.]
MKYTENEVLRFVQENDVKFIRLAFCDIYGNQKNISIMPRELARAFENGIPFQANLIDGFLCKENKLLLIPDPTTMAILPWRPQTGRVVRFFCNIKTCDGNNFICDARYFLWRAAERLEKHQIECDIGTECEFYLFQTDEEGFPTKTPHDYATYFDIAPKDKAENVRREICLSLEQMGITPLSSHHERGPGQNAIVYKYSEPVLAADDFITYKSVVKTIANKNGLYASFMPKPLKTEIGNNLTLSFSLYRNDNNLFCSDTMRESHDASAFAAGLQHSLRELSLFLYSSSNSYERLGEETFTGIINFSDTDHDSAIRIISDDTDQSGLILNITDTCANPYLIFGLLINAGIDGIEQGLSLSAEQQKFAVDLEESISIAKSSKFLNSIVPDEILMQYLGKKKSELDMVRNADSREDTEYHLYFDQY